MPCDPNPLGTIGIEKCGQTAAVSMCIKASGLPFFWIHGVPVRRPSRHDSGRSFQTPPRIVARPLPQAPSAAGTSGTREARRRARTPPRRRTNRAGNGPVSSRQAPWPLPRQGKRRVSLPGQSELRSCCYFTTPAAAPNCASKAGVVFSTNPSAESRIKKSAASPSRTASSCPRSGPSTISAVA